MMRPIADRMNGSWSFGERVFSSLSEFACYRLVIESTILRATEMCHEYFEPVLAYSIPSQFDEHVVVLSC